MPLRWLRRYMREHDRLMASEALQMATRVAVGSGRAKNASALMASWRQAQGASAGPRIDAHKRGELAGTARFLGLPVRTVPRD